MTSIVISMITVDPYTGLPANVHLGLESLYPPDVGCMELTPDFSIGESVMTRTTEALSWLARRDAEGLALKIVAFQVGASGYDPTYFARPTPVVFGSQIDAFRYEGNVTYESAAVDGTAYSYTCRIPAEIRSVFGELALIAEVMYSPDVGEIGTRFPFAVGHCPAVVKHLRSAVTFRAVLHG